MTRIARESIIPADGQVPPGTDSTGRPCCPDCFQRMATGDSAAFALLYQQYRQQVYAYTLLLKAEEQYCDDIVQEIFSRIWVKKEQLGGVADFKAWLFIVTRNFIINWKQKKLREQQNRKAYVDYYQQHLLQAPALRENEYEALLAAAVQQLAPQQKLVYQLQKEYNWHRREIARAMNLSPETIKSHIRVAMREVRKYCLKNGAPAAIRPL